MQVRWNYKLQPNKGQRALMSEWVVTLRKHRNYSLRERENGYNANNINEDQAINYAYGAFCDIETQVEYGAFCPLTCAVVKHGVIPDRVSCEQLLKTSKPKKGEDRPIVVWDSASGIQSKRTTILRSESDWFGDINSDVLQRNLAKLDNAFTGFWQHKRGFPAYRKASNFNSFEYKPGRAKIEVNRESNKKRCYSHITLPGIGRMRYLDSRAIPVDADIRTVTVKKKADGWYISVLLNLPETLPELNTDIQSSVGIDVGINKLVSLSDGSFVENPKFATNKKTRRQMRIRQRRVNRKQKGSKNRAKAGKAVARLHKKIADLREAYQWQAANKIVKIADAVVHEELNIKGMKSRCKPKKQKGRFLPNGQSAKRGLNRSISDAAWGGLFDKIGWIGAKTGKPVMSVPAPYSSQECSACGHRSKNNRNGEKFVCESCGHIDHADTQASRTLNKRAGFKFPKNVRPDVKILPADCGKVTPIRYDSAPRGKRDQAGNRTFKAVPEKRILVEQLHLELFG